jgi:hypothetical protein
MEQVGILNASLQNQRQQDASHNFHIVKLK